MYQSIHFKSKPRATTNASKPEVIEKLQNIFGAEDVLVATSCSVNSIH